MQIINFQSPIYKINPRSVWYIQIPTPSLVSLAVIIAEICVFKHINRRIWLKRLNCWCWPRMYVAHLGPLYIFTQREHTLSLALFSNRGVYTNFCSQAAAHRASAWANFAVLRRVTSVSAAAATSAVKWWAKQRGGRGMCWSVHYL